MYLYFLKNESKMRSVCLKKSFVPQYANKIKGFMMRPSFYK